MTKEKLVEEMRKYLKFIEIFLKQYEDNVYTHESIDDSTVQMLDFDVVQLKKIWNKRNKDLDPKPPKK